MTLESQIVGKWNFASSEGFDEYLKEAGVSFMTRQVAGKLKPSLEFTIENGKWKMTSVSTFKTIVLEWTLGQEFDSKTGDGRDVSELFTVDGDKLIQVEKGKNGGKDSRMERYIENGKLHILCDCNGVKAHRIYEKSA